MKKLLFLLALSFALIACNNTENNPSEQETKEENKSEATPKHIERVSLEVVPKIIEENAPKLKPQFDAYINSINTEITSFDQLLSIYNQRDSLILELEKVLLGYYYNEEIDSSESTWSAIDEEIGKIGINSIYAEGMPQVFDVAPMFEEELNKFAPEDYKIYIEFKNAYSESMGGEYPYLDITGYLKNILIGEKMDLNFKDSKYYELIKEDFYLSIASCLDIHKVVSSGKNEEPSFFNGQLNTEFYPFATTCDGWEEFTTDNPNSIFTPIIQKLSENMSSLTINHNQNKFKAFMVVLDKTDSDNKCNELILNYIKDGVDVVHNIQLLKENDEVEYYTCYRFFTEKKKAKAAYKKISEKYPNAEIIKVETDGYQVSFLKKIKG